MQFHFHANQSHFHRNGFALRLALKQMHKGTRKWPIKPWWRCENLVESTSWILVWIRRCLFAGLEFMFTYFYVHFTEMLHTQHFIITPEKGLGRLHCVPIPTHPTWLVPYVRNYRKCKWRIVFEYCCPLLLCQFHKEKRSVVKSFKLARKFQQIPSFLLNTSENFFFQNICLPPSLPLR